MNKAGKIKEHFVLNQRKGSVPNSQEFTEDNWHVRNAREPISWNIVIKSNKHKETACKQTLNHSKKTISVIERIIYYDPK